MDNILVIKTLENETAEAILETFNSAFSDYSIPFYLELDQLQFKFKTENINLNLSVGAYQDDKLVGFILHGVREIEKGFTIYNGGTGVIPTQRGNGLTQKMYEFIIPTLIQKNASLLKLEVISTNKPAIKSYSNTGFCLKRKLNCYKGQIQEFTDKSKCKIEEIKKINWEILKAFWDITPSWQNSIQSISNMNGKQTTIGAYLNQRLIGYLSLNNTNNRILHLAVDKNYRRKGVARSLLTFLRKNYSKNTSIINVEANNLSINQFFINIGFVKTLQQDEMEMKIT